MELQRLLFEDKWEIPEEGIIRIAFHDNPADIERAIKNLNILDVGLDILPDMKKQPVGPNYKSLCPFHREKTPSFYLKPKYNEYVCYGCGKRGGPLSLLFNYSTNPYIYLFNKIGFLQENQRHLEALNNAKREEEKRF